MEGIITAKNLVFQDKITYPNLAIQPGIATFVTGDSGVGKSTLLKLLNKTLSPSAGTIWYEGRDTRFIDSVELRRDILLAGQNVYLFDKTIRENFAEFYAYRQLPPPEDQTMWHFMKLCSVAFPLDRSCATLSGGEGQRIYLAIFLSLAPRVLLLDEPTSALDGKNAARLLHNIKSHCREKGITLVAVSHDTSLVERYADARLQLCDKGEKHE